MKIDKFFTLPPTVQKYCQNIPNKVPSCTGDIIYNNNNYNTFYELEIAL